MNQGNERSQYATVLGLIFLASVTLILAGACYITRGSIPEFLSGFGIGALSALGTMYQLGHRSGKDETPPL